MWDFIEKVRVSLIAWRIAPLSIVGVLMYAMFDVINYYKSTPDLPEWHVAGIFTFLGAIAGILYKMYDSMQQDRGKDCKKEE